MKVSFRGRVIDQYKSADPNWPGISVTFSDVIIGGQIKVKFPVSFEKRIKLDALLDVSGEFNVSVANQAFGAVRLSATEEVVLADVKDK